MSPQRLTEILKNYRTSKARCAKLREDLRMLERFLKICEGNMIDDMVSMSQALTGMPHGTTVGDPTGRLALDIESGKISPFVREIRDEIEQTREELEKVSSDVRIVEIVLEGMSDIEKDLLTMKMIDEMSWKEIIYKINRKFKGDHTQRTLQRRMDRIMKKASVIVK